MSNSIHWEQIADNTFKLKIEEGYLFKYSDRYDAMMVFVPHQITPIITKRKKK